MSQTIITEHAIELGDVDLNEDSRALAEGVIAAVKEAASLGGHHQLVIGLHLEPHDRVEAFGGPLTRSATLTLETRMI